MKLLFDEQLSPKLARQPADLFPGSAHVHDVGMGQADDRVIWTWARDHGFAIVTKDADFTDLAMAWGSPPKIVWLRLGNCTTRATEDAIRAESEAVAQLGSDPALGTLVLD